MSNAINQTKFGRLTIIKDIDKQIYGFHAYECECECGNKVIVNKYKLLSGHTKSCGCLKLKHKNRLSGETNKRIYSCWRNMLQRCQTRSRKDSKYYYDKGIHICDEWMIFDSFADWALENGYRNDLTLDRINSNGDYSPDNCRWVTMEEQQRNKSNNIYLTYEGITKTLSEWARDYKINRTTLHDRIFKSGWTLKDALNKRVEYSRSINV